MRKIPCGFKEQARARASGEKCGLLVCLREGAKFPADIFDRRLINLLSRGNAGEGRIGADPAVGKAASIVRRVPDRTRRGDFGLHVHRFYRVRMGVITQRDFRGRGVTALGVFAALATVMAGRASRRQAMPVQR